MEQKEICFELEMVDFMMYAFVFLEKTGGFDEFLAEFYSKVALDRKGLREEILEFSTDKAKWMEPK